jgi:hypothetical protein
VSQQFFSSNYDVKPKPTNSSGGILTKFWGKESNVASPNFKNRWAMLVPALMTHICIGKL